MRPKLFGVFGIQDISLVFAKLATYLPLLDVIGIEKVYFGQLEKYRSIPKMAHYHVRLFCPLLSFLAFLLQD